MGRRKTTWYIVEEGKKVLNTYCKGQYPASICGHWEHAAYPLHRIRQGPIVTCNRTNTKKTRLAS